MIMLVASLLDHAGKNIAEECEKLGLPVTYIEEDIIFAKELPEADAYIFLSRHKSESKKPCLTAHFPGNWGENASHGGDGKELGHSYPSLEKIYMKNLVELGKNQDKYQIVLEATHHGPTHLEKPVLFVEIGSSEEQWIDKMPAEIIAKAVKKTIEGVGEKFKTAIAFGGTHYPEKFTDLLIETDYSIGHIFPKYQRENLNEEMMDQMLEKSTEKVEFCIIDGKGTNQKSKIAEWAKNKGLEVIKV